MEKTKSKRKRYTESEDENILNYVKQSTLSPKGKTLYIDMERKKITEHSWQSMKDRYLKLTGEKGSVPTRSKVFFSHYC